MLYFLCNSILHGRRPISPSTTHQLHCLQNYASVIISKHISTTSNADSFTVSYLIKSCGLSQESALSSSKYVHFESPKRPDSVIALFKNHGFSKTQISDLIRRKPGVLLACPEKTLLPKLEFFYSIGFSSHNLTKTLSLCPAILHRSLEKHLIPTFNCLSSLFQSSERTIAVITSSPSILYSDNVETYLTTNVSILRDNGVPDANISMCLRRWPKLLLTKLDVFEEAVKLVKEMGFDPLKCPFVLAIVAKRVMSESLWEKKVNIFKTWGWSDKEFLASFRKYPWCMTASVEKIMAVMDFFVNTMGWEPSIIAKHPILICLSLEKRIRPRAAVIQFLLSNGLHKRKNSNLVTLFLCPEKNLLEEVCECL